MAVDPYIDETTRHADVILPPPTALQKGHYDLALLQLALRNVANYSPPVLPLERASSTSGRSWPAWRWSLQGMGATPIRGRRRPGGADAGGRGGRRRDRAHRRADPEEIVALLGERTGPERLIDLMLRTGPYGDGFGAAPAACRSTCCWTSPTASTSARWSPGCPTCCARPRAWWSWRPSPSSPTSPGYGPRSTPPPTA